MKCYKMLFVLFILFFAANISVYAGFEYGDKSGFSNLEQFEGEHYVIYKNADTDCIELAVVYADDISDRSLIAEKKEQIEVTGISEVSRGYKGYPRFGPGSGEELSPLEKQSLCLTETEDTYYTVKWYLTDNKWEKDAYIKNDPIICENYEEILYSSFPVIEKFSKSKTAKPYYRAYSGKYYAEFDWERGKMENGNVEKYYVLFSKDGVNVSKKVEIPLMNNRDIGGVYSGNGITIAMGTPNMALSDFQRPAGFNSGCIYIFDENCDLTETVEANSLQSCDGFYNGYFYFTSEVYTAKGKSTVNYMKSQDGINYKNITTEEYKTAVYEINKELYKTPFGKYVDINSKNDIYVSNSSDSYKEVVYENDTKFQNRGISMYSDLSGHIIRSASMVNLCGNKYNYITVDYIYKIQLPLEHEKLYDLANGGYAWATDNYIYIDQNIDYILRIPISQFDNQVYVQLNDKILGFDQPPVIEEGRTLVPMRFLFEQMGANVEWNEETKSARATLNNKAVTFVIDDNEAEVDSQPVTMDVPARLINGKTMVPLRFLSEEMGYNVTWDEETRTAVIE